MFSSPERTFDGYLNSIGMLSIDTFVDTVSNRAVNSWDETLSVERINTYIREGYGNTVCE